MTAPSEAMLPFLAARLERAQSLAFRRPFAEWQARVRTAWRAFLPQGETVWSDGKLRHVTGDTGEAVLLRPDGDGPHPAIILLHDHGGRFDIGWRKMVAGHSDAALYEGRHLADWLVSLGYAVLCHDALGWGSRFAGGYDGQQALAAQAMQAGWSLAGITAAEDAGCAEWLARQPGIDPARIAAFGFSFGGFRAWQLAALSPVIRATVSIGWMGHRADLLHDGGTLVKGQSAFHTLHPHLDIDYPDLAALAADRPLFLRVGDADRHFPAPGRAFDRIRQIAPVDAATFAGGHVFPIAQQEMAAEFLGRHLR